MIQQYAFLAINIVVAIAAMILVWLIIDIQSKRILNRQNKGRLVSRNLAQKIIVLSEKKEKEFNKSLNRAKVQLNAREFYFRAIVMAACTGILTYVLTNMFIPGFISIIVTVLITGFSIYYPFHKLKVRLRNDELRKSIELPRYLKIVTTLLRTQPPYDAVRESIKYAPPTILPYAETLLIEITQYPKSSIPYENFAKNLGLREAKQFMNLLYQSLDISQKNSREFIEKLNKMTDELENASSKKLALLQANSMRKYSHILLICIVVLPLALALVTLLEIFNQF